jgi:hypothetical protein
MDSREGFVDFARLQMAWRRGNSSEASGFRTHAPSSIKVKANLNCSQIMHGSLAIGVTTSLP